MVCIKGGIASLSKSANDSGGPGMVGDQRFEKWFLSVNLSPLFIRLGFFVQAPLS